MNDADVNIGDISGVNSVLDPNCLKTMVKGDVVALSLERFG